MDEFKLKFSGMVKYQKTGNLPVAVIVRVVVSILNNSINQRNTKRQKCCCYRQQNGCFKPRYWFKKHDDLYIEETDEPFLLHTLDV